MTLTLAEAKPVFWASHHSKVSDGTSYEDHKFIRIEKTKGSDIASGTWNTPSDQSHNQYGNERENTELNI
jgi:hypothetical protein